MTGKRINTLLWIGLTGTIMIGSSFFVDMYRAFWGDRSIWWTPMGMRLPLEETKDSFELYIAEKPIQKHLSDGTLFGADKNGNRYPVVSKDVTVRLNNWEKTRASILTRTSISGFWLGVAITLLSIGLIRFFRREAK